MRTKFTLIICAVLFSVASFAQENTVTLKTTGSAETKEKAVQYALRSAIEQAFGAFISSNTEILNDELVADEITSVASGNIEKYDILSETVNEAGNSWFVTANVIVSVGKLTEFVQAKGVEVEVKGGLFAINIKQKQLNSDGEYKAILDMLKPFHEAMLNAYDYELEVGQPVAQDQENKNWEVTLKVLANANKNLESALQIIKATLSSLSLTTEELVEYKKLNKEVFLINIGIPGQEKETIGNPQSEDSFSKGTLLSAIADEFGVTINQVSNKRFLQGFIKGSGKEAKLKREFSKAEFVWPKEADPVYYLRNKKSFEVLHFLVKAYLTELYGHNFNVNSSIHNYYSFPDVSVSLDKALLKSQGHAFKIEGEQSTLLSMKEINPYQDYQGRDVSDSRLNHNLRSHLIYENVENYINMLILGGCLSEEELPEFKLFVQNKAEKYGFEVLSGSLKAYGNTKGKYYKDCFPRDEKNEVTLLFKPQKAFEFKDGLTLSDVESLNGYKVSLNKNVFSFSNGGITIKNGDYRIVIPVHPVLSDSQVIKRKLDSYEAYSESTNDQIYNYWNSLCTNETYTDWQVPTAAEVLQIGNQYPFPFYYLRSSDGGKNFQYTESRLLNTSNTFGEVFELINSTREEGLNYDVWRQPSYEKPNNFKLEQDVVDHWGEPYKRRSNTYYIVYKNKPMALFVESYVSGTGVRFGTSVCIRRIK